VNFFSTEIVSVNTDVSLVDVALLAVMVPCPVVVAVINVDVVVTTIDDDDDDADDVSLATVSALVVLVVHGSVVVDTGFVVVVVVDVHVPSLFDLLSTVVKVSESLLELSPELSTPPESAPSNKNRTDL